MPIEADLEAFSPGPVAAHNVRGRAVIYIVTLNVHVPMTDATRRIRLYGHCGFGYDLR